METSSPSYADTIVEEASRIGDAHGTCFEVAVAAAAVRQAVLDLNLPEHSAEAEEWLRNGALPKALADVLRSGGSFE
jgi:hypothetical protein